MTKTIHGFVWVGLLGGFLVSCGPLPPVAVQSKPPRVAIIHLSKEAESPEIQEEWVQAVGAKGVPALDVNFNESLATTEKEQIQQAIQASKSQGYDLVAITFDREDEPSLLKPGGVYLFLAETASAPHFDWVARLYRTADSRLIGPELAKCPTQKDPRHPLEDPRILARKALQNGIAERVEGYCQGRYR